MDPKRASENVAKADGPAATPSAWLAPAGEGTAVRCFERLVLCKITLKKPTGAYFDAGQFVAAHYMVGRERPQTARCARAAAPPPMQPGPRSGRHATSPTAAQAQARPMDANFTARLAAALPAQPPGGGSSPGGAGRWALQDDAVIKVPRAGGRARARGWAARPGRRVARAEPPPPWPWPWRAVACGPCAWAPCHATQRSAHPPSPLSPRPPCAAQVVFAVRSPSHANLGRVLLNEEELLGQCNSGQLRLPAAGGSAFRGLACLRHVFGVDNLYDMWLVRQVRRRWGSGGVGRRGPAVRALNRPLASVPSPLVSCCRWGGR
jgi:hypothetical protein